VSDWQKFDREKFSKDLHDRIHQDIHERITKRMEGRSRPGGMVPGLVLIVIGSLVLLAHMGIISGDRLWRLWPLVLIVVGLIKVYEGCNRVFGVVLTLLGVLLLGSNLGYIRLSWGDLWPLVLIGVGLTLIWSRFEIPKLPQPSSGGPNTINEFAMFGGVERRIVVNNFTSGSVTALFGGVELDFRSADIEGEEAVIIMDATFGGIEITVPDRWTVLYQGQSIFGGYTDETRPPLPDVPGAPPRKRLILRGRAVFGGITVRN
jgi:predicted membrane protein